MTFWIFLIGILIGVILAIMVIHNVAVYPLHKKIDELTRENITLQSTLRKGKNKLALCKNTYPYPRKNFRFIGDPIDGIQFENDQILFVKIKTKKTKLTAKENEVKNLVNGGKVGWFEFKI